MKSVGVGTIIVYGYKNYQCVAFRLSINLQYCQEITWHCVCGRCVHTAGVLRPLCGRFASTLRAFCVHSAGILRPQRPRLLCVRLASGCLRLASNRNCVCLDALAQVIIKYQYSTLDSLPM